MMTDRHAEERIRSWLIATAPAHLPDRVLTNTYERTRRMAQASTVRTWWSRVTRPLPIVFAAGAIAVAVVLVNIRLGSLGDGLGSLGGGANRPLGVGLREHGPDQRPMDHREFGGLLGPVRGAGGRKPVLAGGGVRHLRADRMEADRRGGV